jgi:hypothetical protein
MFALQHRDMTIVAVGKRCLQICEGDVCNVEQRNEDDRGIAIGMPSIAFEERCLHCSNRKGIACSFGTEMSTCFGKVYIEMNDFMLYINNSNTVVLCCMYGHDM